MTVRLDWLLSHFETSSGIGLLRTTHAPYLIDFFYRQFKPSHGRDSSLELTTTATCRTASELTLSLQDYLDQLHESHPDVLTDSAVNYLADWCSSDKRYLRPFSRCDARRAAVRIVGVHRRSFDVHRSNPVTRAAIRRHRVAAETDHRHVD